MPHRDYYARIREICDRHDVLFVAVEILCGYGRTGLPFAIAHWNVDADIVTMGKAIGSGYTPLGAMVVSDKVKSAFMRSGSPFVHGLTYSGMPSACCIGLEVNRIMREERLFARAAAMGEVLRAQLDALAARCPQIGEIRGKGLLAGVELVADRTSATPRATFAREHGFATRVVAAMRESGVMVANGIPFGPAGEHVDQIQISPPFVITEGEIATIVRTLEDAIGNVRDSCSPLRAT